MTVKERARDLVGEPVKRGWRALRPHLPPAVAESIRVPVKQALRKAGLISPAPVAKR